MHERGIEILPRNVNKLARGSKNCMVRAVWGFVTTEYLSVVSRKRNLVSLPTFVFDAMFHPSEFVSGFRESFFKNRD